MGFGRRSFSTWEDPRATPGSHSHFAHAQSKGLDDDRGTPTMAPSSLYAGNTAAQQAQQGFSRGSSSRGVQENEQSAAASCSTAYAAAAEGQGQDSQRESASGVGRGGALDTGGARALVTLVEDERERLGSLGGAPALAPAPGVHAANGHSAAPAESAAAAAAAGVQDLAGRGLLGLLQGRASLGAGPVEDMEGPPEGCRRSEQSSAAGMPPVSAAASGPGPRRTTMSLRSLVTINRRVSETESRDILTPMMMMAPEVGCGLLPHATSSCNAPLTAGREADGALCAGRCVHACGACGAVFVHGGAA